MEAGSHERGRFEGEVLTRLTAIEAALKSMNDGNRLLEVRVRTLENWRFAMLGGAAVIGGSAGWIGRVVGL